MGAQEPHAAEGMGLGWGVAGSREADSGGERAGRAGDGPFAGMGDAAGAGGSPEGCEGGEAESEQEDGRQAERAVGAPMTRTVAPPLNYGERRGK